MQSADPIPPDVERAIRSYLSAESYDPVRYERLAGLIVECNVEARDGPDAIDTYTGERVTPLEPRAGAIHLADIAHSLGNIGRFTGHGGTGYTVAQHTVHVTREVAAAGGGRSAQRYALMHDATEAYLADLPGPVKLDLPGYRYAERELDRTIRERFELTPTPEDVTAVAEADAAVTQWELAVYLRDEDPPSLAHEIERIPHRDAAEQFLETAVDLGVEPVR